MADVFTWTKEIPVPVGVIQYIDDGVKESLPPGTKFLEIYPSGASYWARTAKIDAQNAEGEETPFFIKVHQKEIGKAMVSAEYRATKQLYEAMPDLVAEPIAWGPYRDEPDTWFYVCRYCELSEDIPDLYDFPKMLAEMHKRGQSTTGEFGSDTVSFGGRLPQVFPITKSWEETFSRGMEHTFSQEERTHGPNEELSQLRDAIMNKVIPRLIRPLETEGRKLIPTLVHGDLWDGNASVDVNTGLPKIFDCTTIYAHNEYDLAPWWASRHKMTSAYIAEYNKHYPLTEPAEDFRDRGVLYCLRFDLHASSLYTGDLRHRFISMDTMRYLTKKYVLGYEGYQKEKASQIQIEHPLKIE